MCQFLDSLKQNTGDLSLEPGKETEKKKKPKTAMYIRPWKVIKVKFQPMYSSDTFKIISLSFTDTVHIVYRLIYFFGIELYLGLLCLQHNFNEGNMGRR